MKLKKLEVNAFAGIDPSSPIVIDFTQSKFITVTGDQGTKKTSLLTAMLVACGQISKDNKDFVNLSTGKIDIDFSFVGKDNASYEVKVTKSSFKLMYEGVAQPEPISKMKQLLGVTGTSPMEIKFKPLKDIIKWLSSYSNKSAEEFDAQLLKYKNGIKAARESRAAANKSLKGIDEYLGGQDMYADWEGSEKKYSKEIDIKKLSAELSEAGKKSDRYLLFEDRLKQKTSLKPRLENEVELLKQQLAAKELELKTCVEDIEKGELWLKENVADKKNYDAVKKRYDTAAQDQSDYNKWQEIKAKKSERDEFETLSQKADAKEKELLDKVKEFQSELLPNIKDVRIVTEDTTEDGVLWKEGLYWGGVNVAQMSESEWTDIVVEIWRKNKVKVVVLDNIGTLGSGAVDRLTKLSKDGCTILSAEMNRKVQELQISYE